MEINALNELRDQVRKADREMAALFTERMEAVAKIAQYKSERGLPIEDKAQEARVIADRGPLVEDPDLRSFYVECVQHTMDVSKAWQHRLLEGQKTAYCGVPGAFAHIAAKKIFPDGQAVSFPSFEEAYRSVAEGRCDTAVLPLENSYAGEVGQVLDLMFSGPLHVNGVYDLGITQDLLGVPGAAMEDIHTVVSHPQAIAQCRKYIEKHGFEIREASNTAVAAKEAAERKDPSVAVIASEETAALYGLEILDHDINESRVNTTRFAVFSRVANTPPDTPDNKKGSTFILLFTVKDEVGGLAKAINIISAYNINMRVLRSRPMKDLAWHYYFYAEAEGNVTSENGQRMVNALKGACPMVKIAGQYTAGEIIL